MIGLYEKVDYAHDPEAPISIGMKLLKRLEKDGWKGGDIYYEIEDIVVDADVDHPKQMALRLKRALTNYDMWEAPYKGLVNKIEKWQYVNESMEDYNTYYDDYYDPRTAKRCKFEFFIKPHRDAKVYDKVLYGDLSNVKLEYEDDNYLEVSVPHFDYNAIVKIGNELLDRNLIEDFSLVESVNEAKSGKCPKSGCIKKKPNGKWGVISNKTGKFWNADYDTKHDAEDGLKAYHVNEIAPVVAAVGSQVAKQVVAQAATQAAGQVAQQVANQAAGQTQQQNTQAQESTDKLGRRHSKRKFGYHGSTRRGGRRVNEIAPVVAAVGAQVAGQVANQVAGQVANQVAGQVSQAMSNVTDSDHEFDLSRRHKRHNKRRNSYKHTNESFSSDLCDEVYMIAYANDMFDVRDIKRFIDMNEIIYEDDYQIEFYTCFPDDVQGELDAHGIEWDIDMNY